MSEAYKDWIDVISKAAAAIGIVIAALNYRRQVVVRRGEWLKSLFEKFYENNSFKEVRRWIDSGEIDKRVNLENISISKDDELFTDYLNFFEFIAKLEADGHLKLADVTDLFEYYLKRLNDSTVCAAWIEKFGFEKLKCLLNKIR